MKPAIKAALAVTAIAGGAIAIPLLAQNAASGPVARYDMRAGTVSGAGAMVRRHGRRDGHDVRR